MTDIIRLNEISLLSEDSQDLKSFMNEAYNNALTINQAFWTEADVDTKFKIGDQQFIYDYYGSLGIPYNKKFNFNRMMRIANLITGFQRRNRKSTIATPVEHNDEQASSQWTKVLFNVMSKANANEIISEAFEGGAVTTGLSLMNCWMDYSKDPICGDLMIDHVPYNSFLIDPYFRKNDLSDCNYIWRREWRAKNAIKMMMPKSRHKIIDSINSNGFRDNKFQFMPENLNYASNKLLPCDEFWYKTTRKAIFLVDPEVGLSKEWRADIKEAEAYTRAYPQLKIHKIEIPTVNVIVSVADKIVYHGKNPLEIDKYPFVPVFGYYEPSVSNFQNRVQGVMRGLRDAQYLYNRRKVIELDIFESQLNSGLKYKPTSLVNPRDAFQRGQGKGLAMKAEADMNDVQPLPVPNIPTSMIELSEILGREIMEISGVNEELLGSATDDKAGVLSMLRQGAGLTTLQKLFDQLDFSQKLLGGLCLDIIRNNYTYGKIYRILGEQPVQEFKYKVWLDYDIRIEEGVNTTTQRQLQFAQLLHLKEMGLPIPTKTIVEAATLQDKDKLIEDIEAQEQQEAQAQQAQAETQLALLQAQIKDLEARAVANQGLGDERVSRIQENRALAIERLSQSQENRQSATLDMAKTIKELQGIDLAQVQQLLGIVEVLKNMTETENATKEAENVERAKMPQAFQQSNEFINPF